MAVDQVDVTVVFERAYTPAILTRNHDSSLLSPDAIEGRSGVLTAKPIEAATLTTQYVAVAVSPDGSAVSKTVSIRMSLSGSGSG